MKNSIEKTLPETFEASAEVPADHGFFREWLTKIVGEMGQGGDPESEASALVYALAYG